MTGQLDREKQNRNQIEDLKVAILLITFFLTLIFVFYLFKEYQKMLRIILLVGVVALATLSASETIQHETSVDLPGETCTQPDNEPHPFICNDQLDLECGPDNKCKCKCGMEWHADMGHCMKQGDDQHCSSPGLSFTPFLFMVVAVVLIHL